VNCTKEASIFLEGAAPQVDNRKTVEVCKVNNLIPDNLSAAQKYGLTTPKVILSTKLSNTFQQAAYDKYLAEMENSIYLASDPATANCPVPLGADNAPIVDISKPTVNQSVVAGSSLEISGSVAFLSSISSFSVTLDSVAIAGATLQPSGLYVVNYLIPVGTTVGAHTITITATDSDGKSGSASVSIDVVAATPPTT